jgi:hypothetical protein
MSRSAVAMLAALALGTASTRAARPDKTRLDAGAVDLEASFDSIEQP